MALSKKFNTGPEAVAGNGSKLNPKKPDYRSASGYSPEEDVNAGPHGGKKGKVSPFHDQNSDNWAAEHNKLVGQSDYQKDPYRAKGSDFPVKAVDARTGQSGSHGMSSGHNELVMQGIGLEGARHAEDDGPMTPVPGDRSRVVASYFPIEVSKGEGSSDTGEIGISEMVDLECGYIVGGDTGVTDRVPESKVSVGKPPARNMKAGMVGQQRKG
jgi:hypothetical protein